jgi:hypothetical protein
LQRNTAKKKRDIKPMERLSEKIGTEEEKFRLTQVEKWQQ